MTTLNAIQILDIQDLIKAHVEKQYKKLSSGRCESKVLLMSEIKRLEQADKILDVMWAERMASED